MHIHQDSGLRYYTFDSFAPVESGGLVHAISTRHGGVSPAPFRTLNLGNRVGDANANVAANNERWHTALGLDFAATVDADQVHGNSVAVVDARARGRRLPDVDALLTNVRGVPLMLRFADCVPILLYDPAHRAIGIVHAGWRGTVLKITSLAARAMFETYGTRPGDLIAGIGPSIGPCCYRVSADVAGKAVDAFGPHADLVVSHNGGVHLDLWQANAFQLRELGVEQIEIAGVCTADHVADWFSWRAENHETGRFAAIIELDDDSA